MSRETQALVRRFFEEIWNDRRAETADELIAADAVCYADDGPMIGPEEFKQRQFVPFTAAFPDLKLTVDEIIGEGDVVAVRWSAAATHCGDGLGCAPTQEPIAITGMSWVRCKDGKMVEGWQSSNLPGVLQGLMMKANG